MPAISQPPPNSTGSGFRTAVPASDCYPIGQAIPSPSEKGEHGSWHVTSTGGFERIVLYLAVFLSPFIPFRFSDFLFTVSDLLFAILFCLLLLSGRIPLSPLGRASSLWFLAFSLLMVGLLSSSLVQGDPMRGFIVTSQYFFAYVLLLLVLVRDDPNLIYNFLKVFVLSIFVMDVHGIFMFFTGGSDPSEGKSVVTGSGRLATLLGNPNAAAALNALTVPLLLYLWLAGRVVAMAAIPILAVFIATVILTSSNSGIAALTLSVIAFVATSMNRRMLMRIMMLTTVGAVAFYFGGTELLPESFQKRVLSGIIEGDVSQTGTFNHRAELMREASSIIAERGIFFVGLGADQFREVSVQAAPVHNMYLLLWVEGGVLALIGWLLFSAAGLSVGLAARMKGADPQAGATLIAILLVFYLAAVAIPHMYARHWLIPVMLSLALAMISLRNRTRPTPAA